MRVVSCMLGYHAWQTRVDADAWHVGGWTLTNGDVWCVGKGKVLADRIMHAEDDSGVLHVGLSCMVDSQLEPHCDYKGTCMTNLQEVN